MLRNVARRIRNGAANRLVRPISILGRDFKGWGSNTDFRDRGYYGVDTLDATFGLECEHISVQHLL